MGASLTPPRPAAPPSGSGAPRPPGVEAGLPGPWAHWGESLDGEGSGAGAVAKAPRCPCVPHRWGRPAPAHPGLGHLPPLQPSQSPANFFRRCEGDFFNSGAYLIVAAEGGPRGHGNLGERTGQLGAPAWLAQDGGGQRGPGHTWQAYPGRAPATCLTTGSTCTAALGPSEGLASAPPTTAPGQGRPACQL